MWTAIISGITAIATTLTTLFYKNRQSKREANLKEKISDKEIKAGKMKGFYDDVLERIGSLEKGQRSLKKQLTLWKSRYWALYKWLVSLYQTGAISQKPPRFHQMSKKDINTKFESNIGHEETETAD